MSQMQSQKISDAKYSRTREFPRTSKLFTLDMVSAALPGQNILDVGCGTGLNAEALKEKGYDVHGVDISPVAIDQFTERGFKGKACNILEGLPYPDNTFDFVFSSEVIEHVDDTEKFLSEIFRVMKPGGKLVLSTPNSAFWIYRMLGTFGKTVTELQHPGHLRFFSPKSLHQFVKNSGFSEVKIAARHMYIVLGETLGKACMPLLKPAGLQPEHRFRAGKDFYQISRFSEKASSFWADTLILTASKS